ncbi:MAG TPA: hypothetical protein VFT89_04630 [Rhizobiaceae bacterium]|nr:hypothetical protein [Rhizobiaceae bacterium]
MKNTLTALALSTALLAGPAVAAYSPNSTSLEQTVVPGSIAELNLQIKAPATAKQIKPQQLALANGCEDPWWTRSGWQVIAEWIWDVCG